MPKTVLAHRLVVWERGLGEEELNLVKDIVKDCRVFVPAMILCCLFGGK